MLCQTHLLRGFMPPGRRGVRQWLIQMGVLLDTRLLYNKSFIFNITRIGRRWALNMIKWLKNKEGFSGKISGYVQLNRVGDSSKICPYDLWRNAFIINIRVFSKPASFVQLVSQAMKFQWLLVTLASTGVSFVSSIPSLGSLRPTMQTDLVVRDAPQLISPIPTVISLSNLPGSTDLVER